MDARSIRLTLALLVAFPTAGLSAGAGRRGGTPKSPLSLPARPVPPLIPSVSPVLRPLSPSAEIQLPQGAEARLPLPAAAVPAAPLAAAPPSATAKDELGAVASGTDGVYDGSGKPQDAVAAAPDGRAAVPDGTARNRRSSRASLNFYNRQQPSSKKPETRKHQPTPDETRRAREAFLAIGEARGELFNAPTWIEKAYFPELKATIFGIALLDEALTDFANGQEADVPADVPEGSDVLGALLERRAALLARHAAEAERIRSLPRTKAQRKAWNTLEAWHRQGLVSSFLDNADALKHWEFRKAAMIFRQMRKIALGRNKKADARLVSRLARDFRLALGEGVSLHEAARADAALAALRSGTAAAPAEAKKIYDGAIAEAKNGNLARNQAHMAARLKAQEAGTVFAAPNLGKQIRPTCTVHMLQSLLASMGVHRGLDALIREARVLLNDPYVGMTTPFTLEMQQRLFRHYGRVGLRTDGFFETLVKKKRALKVGIEIGDPVYKHSLILEGFYFLNGQTFIALRDSTSYFPIRFALEDFARLLTGDAAVVFLEAYDKPHGLPRQD